MRNPQSGHLLAQQSQHTTIDQLCYTWSTVGYSSSLAAGFRIRAASPGLQTVNDSRVKSLDRYLRYNLPEGADRFEVQKNLEQAPICLALIQLESGELILVHKKYIGQDGVNRLGSFFIHLLAGLPSDFSVKDAISLWRSSAFWLTSEVDKRLDSSVQLNSLTLSELLQYSQRIDVLHPQGIETSLAENAFPHFLLAYLQWRQLWEQYRQSASPSEPPRLYIIAPPDMIAAFLYGLALCLPKQLLTDLTFSTYEDDVRKSPVLLVGTCWLPDSNGLISHDLPRECYNIDKGIVFNCNRPMPALKQELLLENHFVIYATSCLKHETMADLEELIEGAGEMEKVDVNDFLNAYHQFIVNASTLSPEKVETILKSSKRAIKMLSMPNEQGQINSLALSDPTWYRASLALLLGKLSNQSEHDPKLAKALVAYADSVSHQALKAVQEDQSKHFRVMLHILGAAVPPERTSEPWMNLLKILKQSSQTTLVFFSRHTDCYYEVLQWFQRTQPRVNIQIEPLLKVFWTESERFFSLDLPLEWKRLAFLADPIVTTKNPFENQYKQKAIQNSERYFVRFVQNLENLVMSEGGWEMVEQVFDQLARNSYPDKVSLLKILIESPVSAGREEELIKKAHLNPKECKEFLQHYGPRYIPSTQAEGVIWKKYASLTKGNLQWKKEIMYAWLSPMDGWLVKPENLELLLRKVALPLDEGREFLENRGIGYFERYEKHNTRWFSSKEFPVLYAYIEDFIINCNIKLLHESKFLSFLSKSYIYTSHLLPEDICNRVGSLHILKKFFAQPSPDIPTLTEELASALSLVSSSKDATFIDELATAFFRCVRDRVDFFVVITSLIPFISTFDLMQLLYGMAEQVRDDAAEIYKKAGSNTKDFQNLQLEYIYFAFRFGDMYPKLSPHYYDHFLYSFLDLLLQTTNDEVLKFFGARMSYSEKWDAYIKSRSFTKTVQAGSYRSNQSKLPPVATPTSRAGYRVQLGPGKGVTQATILPDHGGRPRRQSSTMQESQKSKASLFSKWLSKIFRSWQRIGSALMGLLPRRQSSRNREKPQVQRGRMQKPPRPEKG